jgi:hypothetical protein
VPAILYTGQCTFYGEFETQYDPPGEAMAGEGNHDIHEIALSLREEDDRAFRRVVDRLSASRNEECFDGVMAGPDYAERIERALADQQHLRDLLRAVLPDQTPTSDELFERLALLHSLLGISETTNRIVGRIWSDAIPKSETHICEGNLNAFANLEARKLWTMIGSLHIVLVEHSLRPPFAANFLTAVACRVAADLGGGIFLEAVRKFCEQQSSVALNALSDVFGESTGARLQLGVTTWF